MGGVGLKLLPRRWKIFFLFALLVLWLLLFLVQLMSYIESSFSMNKLGILCPELLPEGLRLGGQKIDKVVEISEEVSIKSDVAKKKKSARMYSQFCTYAKVLVPLASCYCLFFCRNR